MPSGNRTGPIGQGTMTGRALGFCTGYDSPGFTKGFGMGVGRGAGRGFGRGIGLGRGHGFGRGFSWGYWDAPWDQSLSKEDEIRMLKSQADSLSRTQKDIEQRLNELEKKRD